MSAVPAERTRTRRKARSAATPAAPARTRTRARSAQRARLDLGSAIPIAICALLMVGIVTVQVAVLQLNGQRGRLQQQLEDLKSGNSSLQNAANGGGRLIAIKKQAAAFGMVQLPVTETQYLKRAR